MSSNLELQPLIIKIKTWRKADDLVLIFFTLNHKNKDALIVNFHNSILTVNRIGKFRPKPRVSKF